MPGGISAAFGTYAFALACVQSSTDLYFELSDKSPRNTNLIIFLTILGSFLIYLLVGLLGYFNISTNVFNNKLLSLIYLITSPDSELNGNLVSNHKYLYNFARFGIVMFCITRINSSAFQLFPAVSSVLGIFKTNLKSVPVKKRPIRFVLANSTEGMYSGANETIPFEISANQTAGNATDFCESARNQTAIFDKTAEKNVTERINPQEDFSDSDSNWIYLYKFFITFPLCLIAFYLVMKDRDAGVAVEISGAVLNSIMCFVIPGLANLIVRKLETENEGNDDEMKVPMWLSALISVVGVVLIIYFTHSKLFDGKEPGFAVDQEIELDPLGDMLTG